MEKYKEIIDNFIKSLPDDEKINKEIIDSFNIFLSSVASNIVEIEPKYKNNIEFINQVVEQRARYIINLSIDEKKSKLIKDEYFEKLKDISNIVYNEALKKVSGENIKYDVSKYECIKNELKEIMEKIKLFNKDEADRIYSETLLDISYLSSDNVTSLRISKVIRDYS